MLLALILWGAFFKKKKKNSEGELLEILCSHSDVAKRTLPAPPPQKILLLSHADMAGNHGLVPEGDSGAQSGGLTPLMDFQNQYAISEHSFCSIFGLAERYQCSNLP